MLWALLCRDWSCFPVYFPSSAKFHSSPYLFGFPCLTFTPLHPCTNLILPCAWLSQIEKHTFLIDYYAHRPTDLRNGCHIVFLIFTTKTIRTWRIYLQAKAPPKLLIIFFLHFPILRHTILGKCPGNDFHLVSSSFSHQWIHLSAFCIYVLLSRLLNRNLVWPQVTMTWGGLFFSVHLSFIAYFGRL